MRMLLVVGVREGFNIHEIRYDPHLDGTALSLFDTKDSKRVRDVGSGTQSPTSTLIANASFGHLSGFKLGSMLL